MGNGVSWHTVPSINAIWCDASFVSYFIQYKGGEGRKRATRWLVCYSKRLHDLFLHDAVAPLNVKRLNVMIWVECLNGVSPL
jgi:hypothetical protein